jgi:hypothetical protein
MAKKKLNAAQKESLKQELAAGIKAGKPVIQVVTPIAEKYGISTVTARWYLKRMGILPKGKRGRPPGSGKKQAGPGGPPGKRGPGRPPGSGRKAAGAFPDLAALAKRAQDSVRRAKLAQRLLPLWEALSTKEKALRAEGAALEKKLSKIAAKAKKLGERIFELVRA